MKIYTGTFLIITLLLSTISNAQEHRLSFEFNSGASYYTKNLGGADLKIGGGFEGVFAYRVMPHLQLLGGWGWNKFSSDNSFAGRNIDFEETGYIFGFQFKHPFAVTNFQYYIRLNGLYNHIELENEDGEIIDDTGHGFGFQTAIGIALPISESWTLTPGVKFNTLERTLDSELYSKKLQQNYLSLRVGIEYQF